MNKKFFIGTMLGNIRLYAFGIGIFAYCIGIKTTCPKISAPKKFFHIFMFLKNLLCCYAFDYCHYSTHRQSRHALYKKMDMVIIHAYFNKVDFISP